MNLLITVLVIVFAAQALGIPQGTYNDRGNQGSYNNGGNSGSYQQRPQQQQQQQQQQSEYNKGSNAGYSGNSGSQGSPQLQGAGYNQTGNGTDLDSRFGFFGGNHGSSGFTGLLQNLMNRPSSTGHQGSNNFLRPIRNNGEFGGNGQGGYGSNGNYGNNGFGSNGYYGNNNENNGYGSNGYYGNNNGNNGYGNNGYGNENSEYNQGQSSPIREIASSIFGNGDNENQEQSGGIFGSGSSSGGPLMDVISDVFSRGKKE